jgi:hypothetical protein
VDEEYNQVPTTFRLAIRRVDILIRRMPIFHAWFADRGAVVRRA